MTGKDLLKMIDDLKRYLSTYNEFIKRKENKNNIQCYAEGQLGSIERKSIEPIADAKGISPRQLQLFFSRAKWDEDGVRDKLQQTVANNYGDKDGIFLVDETSDAKKGKHTAGVARQYCGESGKIDNCIVSVHLGYTHKKFHSLLDGELFLPECWDSGSENKDILKKRKDAGIPDNVGHETKTSIAISQIKRAIANGVPGQFVSADEGYGGKPWWRKAIGKMKLIYVVEIPKNIYGWTKGLLRSGKKAKRVDILFEEKNIGGEWKLFRVHDTKKGPEIWEFKKVMFMEKSKDSDEKMQQLMVARNIRTKEIKYFLTNAEAGTEIETIIRVAFSRWRIERCFQDCKTELGLNHAEMRNYRSLHRHFILTAVNYYFLQDWLLRNKGKKRELECKPMC